MSPWPAMIRISFSEWLVSVSRLATRVICSLRKLLIRASTSERDVIFAVSFVAEAFPAPLQLVTRQGLGPYAHRDRAPIAHLATVREDVVAEAAAGLARLAGGVESIVEIGAELLGGLFTQQPLEGSGPFHRLAVLLESDRPLDTVVALAGGLIG